MSINPFLKHPILQFVGYEMMKKPTLEGIKVNLKKESEKGKWGRIILPSLWFLYALPYIVQGRIGWGTIGIVFGISGIFILRWEGKWYKRRFKISDKEILEQIQIHKEWNND